MKSWTYSKETKSYLDEDGNEYIIRAGRPIKISSSDKNKDIYFRGLQNKYDPNFDKSKLDNPNGYESWTDSYDLAKEYAGKDGYVYSIEIDKDKVNKEDIFDKDGERSLMYSNDKPVALREVSGEEYMLYTDHDNWKDLDYKEVSSPENNLLVQSEINVPEGIDMYVADNVFEKEVILPRDTELVLKGVELKESGKTVLQYDLVKKDSEELKNDGFSVRYLDNNGEELQVNANSREEADILKEQLTRGRIYDSDGNLIQSDREPIEVLPKNDNIKEPRLSNSEISRLERLLYNNPDEKELRDFIKETELPWNYSDKNRSKQELWMMLKYQLEKEKEIRK